MTEKGNEETIKLVKEVTGMSLDWDDAHYEALQMAIGALEKEPILDKIRAEIEQIELLASYTRGDIKQIALDIVDKYKTGSEVENESN